MKPIDTRYIARPVMVAVREGEREVRIGQVAQAVSNRLQHPYSPRPLVHLQMICRKALRTSPGSYHPMHTGQSILSLNLSLDILDPADYLPPYLE